MPWLSHMSSMYSRVWRQACHPPELQWCLIGCSVSGHLQVVPNDAAKMPWLKAKLPGFIDAGDVLVFANQKARVDNVCQELQAGGFRHARSSLTRRCSD